MDGIALIIAQRVMRKQLPSIVQSIIKQKQIVTKFKKDNPPPKYELPKEILELFKKISP